MILVVSTIIKNRLSPFGYFQRDFCFILLVLFTGCAPKLEKTTPDEFRQELRGNAQGTTWEIVFYDIRERNFHFSVDSILHEIDRSISTYLPGSTIDVWNQSDSGCVVDQLFLEVYLKAWAAYNATDRAFDPTVMPLVSYWGFGPEKFEHPESIDSSSIDSLRKFIGLNKLELYVAGKKQNIDSLISIDAVPPKAFLRKPDPRIKLDFNAIGQGWSVDKVGEFFQSMDVKVFFIEIGGEIVAGNPKPDGELWHFGIDKPLLHPTNRELQAIIDIRNRGMATSGNYRKFYERDGIKYPHTIDPATGYPVKHGLLSATVLSSNAAEADALATAFMVMGKDSTVSYLNAHSYLSVYAYLIFDSAGTVYTYTSPQIVKSIRKVD